MQIVLRFEVNIFPPESRHFPGTQFGVSRDRKHEIPRILDRGNDLLRLSCRETPGFLALAGSACSGQCAPFLSHRFPQALLRELPRPRSSDI
jgi:hypothetical protein